MLQLVCVPPAEVWKIWPRIEGLVDKAFAAFDMPIPVDIREQMRRGTRLLWVAVDTEAKIVGISLTQLFEMRSGKVCKILESAGSQMSECLELMPQIEQYAKREGCSRVIVEGRPGWARMLPDYRTIGVTLEKRIESDG